MINRLTLIVNRQGHPFIRFLNKVIKKRNCEYSDVTKKKNVNFRSKFSRVIIAANNVHSIMCQQHIYQGERIGIPFREREYDFFQ